MKPIITLHDLDGEPIKVVVANICFFKNAIWWDYSTSPPVEKNGSNVYMSGLQDWQYGTRETPDEIERLIMGEDLPRVGEPFNESKLDLTPAQFARKLESADVICSFQQWDKDTLRKFADEIGMELLRRAQAQMRKTTA